MSSVRGAGRGFRLNVDYGSWELIWNHVHRVLVVNVGLAVADLPLLAALQYDHRPWRHVLPFGLLAMGVGPALAAAFGYLEGAGEDGRAPARDMARAYRRLFRRALALWVPFALLAGITATDAYVLRHTTLGLAVIPALAVLSVVAAHSGVLAMAQVARARPASTAGTAGTGRITARSYLAAPYALVRRWPLGLVNLTLLALTLVLVNRTPLLGLAVLPGCALFVVWRNAHTMLPGADRTAGTATGRASGPAPGSASGRAPDPVSSPATGPASSPATRCVPGPASGPAR